MRTKNIIAKLLESMNLLSFQDVKHFIDVHQSSRTLGGPDFYVYERRKLGCFQIAVGDIAPFRFMRSDGGPFSWIDAQVSERQCALIRQEIYPQVEKAISDLEKAFIGTYDTYVTPGTLALFLSDKMFRIAEVHSVLDNKIIGEAFTTTYDRQKPVDLEDYLCNLKTSGPIQEGEPCAFYSRAGLVASGFPVGVSGEMIHVRFQPDIGTRKRVFLKKELDSGNYTGYSLIPIMKNVPPQRCNGPYR